MGVASLVAGEKFGLEVNTEKGKEKKDRFVVIFCEMNRRKVRMLTWVMNGLYHGTVQIQGKTLTNPSCDGEKIRAADI